MSQPSVKFYDLAIMGDIGQSAELKYPQEEIGLWLKFTQRIHLRSWIKKSFYFVDPNDSNSLGLRYNFALELNPRV